MKRDSLLRTGAATFAGIAFGAAATFVLTGLVSNNLGAETTGLYFQAIAIFAIASSALQLGADTALVRTLSRQLALGETSSLRPTVWIAVAPVIAVGAAFGLTAWFAADALAAAMAPADSAAMAETIRALAPFVGVGATLAVLLGGTRGVGGALPYTLIQNVALPVLRLALVAIAVVSGLSVQWIVGLWVLPLGLLMALAAVVLAVMLTRARSLTALTAPVADAPPILELARIWRFALPRGLSTLIEKALDWGGVLLVIAIAGPVQGAVYAVVTRCANAGYMIDQAVRVVVGPRISRALAVGAKDEAEALFLSVTRVLVMVGWPFYLTLAVFAPTVLGLFGEEFVSGAPALTLVALALMLATTAGMVQSILLMGGKSVWQLFNRTVQLATLLTVTAIAVPHLGIVGAAIGWMSAIVVDTTLASAQVAFRMGLRSSLRLIAVPAVIAFAVFGCGGLLLASVLGQSLGTVFVAALLLGGTYLTACFALRTRLGIAEVFARRTPSLAPSTLLPGDVAPVLIPTKEDAR